VPEAGCFAAGSLLVCFFFAQRFKRAASRRAAFDARTRTRRVEILWPPASVTRAVTLSRNVLRRTSSL
jgi:hypothetical protein